MTSDSDSGRTGLGGALFAGVLIALMGYLTLAALQGQHGLFSLIRVEAQEERLQLELDDLQAERDVLLNKTQRLSPGGIDLDLLDEQARKVLGLARPDELLVH